MDDKFCIYREEGIRMKEGKKRRGREEAKDCFCMEREMIPNQLFLSEEKRLQLLIPFLAPQSFSPSLKPAMF